MSRKVIFERLKNIDMYAKRYDKDIYPLIHRRIMSLMNAITTTGMKKYWKEKFVKQYLKTVNKHINK